MDMQSNERLSWWINRHYRDRPVPEDFRDPVLARESMAALDELSRLFHLGSAYDFQKASRRLMAASLAMPPSVASVRPSAGRSQDACEWSRAAGPWKTAGSRAFPSRQSS